MDVFKIHEQLISDYRSFTSGSVEVRDRRIKAHVDRQLDEGMQWPDPWLSLNPSFESGGTVTDLVKEGLLDEECERIFRVKTNKDDPGSTTLTLHKHQTEAIEAASSGKSYVLTTGTGSGKSLAYIVPIVDSVLRERAATGGQRSPGVKAIVVYPMNALANSQLLELEKFLNVRLPLLWRAGPVRALHGPGGRRGPAPDPRRPARHPAHQLRDARAGPDPTG